MKCEAVWYRGDVDQDTIGHSCPNEAKFKLLWTINPDGSKLKEKWYCADCYDKVIACWRSRVMTDDPDDNPRYAGTLELMELNGVS
jgi:hypothetical protein